MMKNTNKFIFSYHSTHNLGDAVQTFALARLLPQPLAAMYRHKMHHIQENEVFVANGFLYDVPVIIPQTLFAGVFVGNNHNENLDWIKKSIFPIGARDPFTQKYLKENGVESEMIGCATLTLPRYEGPRSGILLIDDGRNCPMTHNCSIMSWPIQWQMAIGSLEMIKKAALVVTKRLHVILPCLAMGTPVYTPDSIIGEVLSPERLTLLDHLGYRFNEVMEIDVSELAASYVKFLEENLKTKINPIEFPEFVSPRSIIPTGGG